MRFKEWIKMIVSSGNLCSRYTNMVDDAMSKKDLMDIVLDANGVSYLLEMNEKGLGLPYETINEEFYHYINGRYVAEFKNKKGNGYTSKLFCCYCDGPEICANTTALVLLGCSNRVVVPENRIVKIYVDANCDIELYCPSSSNAIVEYSTGAIISTCGTGKVEFICRNNGQREN